MATLALSPWPKVRGALQQAREICEAIMAESGTGCTWVDKYLQRIAEDSIRRGIARSGIYLSEPNKDKLLDASKREASEHEFGERLQLKLEPKKLYESAGIRGATIAGLSSLFSVLLLLFMPPDIVRDAVVAALTVLSTVGSAVAWVGRKRATRTIL